MKGFRTVPTANTLVKESRTEPAQLFCLSYTTSGDSNIYGKVVAGSRKAILLELELLNTGLTQLTVKDQHFNKWYAGPRTWKD